MINSCSNIKRLGQKGTWITPGLKKSFIKLHEMGLAISVEVWKTVKLLGAYMDWILEIFFVVKVCFQNLLTQVN